MTFFEPSFPEAMWLLLGESGIKYALYTPKEKKTVPSDLLLPPKHYRSRRIFSYLQETRCIHADIVSHFLSVGTLYEDSQYHNMCFVGTDLSGTPRHVQKHSSFQGSSFKQTVKNSNGDYGFCYRGNNHSLFLFESPIDLLSYLSLHPKCWEESNYLSLSGVSGRPIHQFLKDSPHIQEIIFCLDNDEPGRKATERLMRELSEVNQELILCTDFPALKDWNDDLMSITKTWIK